MYKFLLTAILGFPILVYSQQINVGMLDRNDTADAGKIKVQGYVDAYYGFDFNRPNSGERAYAISSSRHSEATINLAYIDISYTNKRVRARLTPGFGSYMNNNYALEKGTFKNLIEATVGINLSPEKNIWFDAGIFGSPFTNETAISKDHLLYTRSFSPEYSPYYFSGARLSFPILPNMNGYLYLVNGWQKIEDNNAYASVVTQIEYNINKKLLVNWSNYAGNESSVANPHFKNRYFTDIYALFNTGGKLSFTGDFSFGIQEYTDTINNATKSHNWWVGNICAGYKINDEYSVTGRFEYMEDLNEIMVSSITNQFGFSSYSSSLCVNRKFGSNAIFRLEGRTAFSNKEVYLDRNGNNATNDNLLIGNITVWF